MPRERRSTHLLCGRSYVRPPGAGREEVIAQLAGRQHGVVARRQLLALGISERAVDHRLRIGSLRPVFPGAYAVGHGALTWHGRLCAGVLAATSRQQPARSPRAVISHMSAAALWGLIDGHRGSVHISSSSARKPPRGMVAHRAQLPDGETTLAQGIPVTTVARTLLDLSAPLDRTGLRRLMKRAEFLSLVHGPDLVEILERHPRRKGRRALASLVTDGTAGSGRTRSDLEDEFLAFCRRHRLPHPETNQVLHLRGERFEVDCVWRDERLAVELDGWQAHGGRMAFEDDRARDRRLAAAGWTVVRVTWSTLRDEPETLVAELRTLLARTKNVAPPTQGVA